MARTKAKVRRSGKCEPSTTASTPKHQSGCQKLTVVRDLVPIERILWDQKGKMAIVPSTQKEDPGSDNIE